MTNFADTVDHMIQKRKEDALPVIAKLHGAIKKCAQLTPAKYAEHWNNITNEIGKIHLKLRKTRNLIK